MDGRDHGPAMTTTKTKPPPARTTAQFFQLINEMGLSVTHFKGGAQIFSLYGLIPGGPAEDSEAYVT
jgi:hypothetical protein